MGAVILAVFFVAGIYGFWRFIRKDDLFEQALSVAAAVLCFLCPLSLILWTYLLRFV
jgi:hypothetical protein